MGEPPPTAADLEGMRLALAEADQAGAEGEVPVGAVVMRGGGVIAAGHNAMIARRDPTAHAEVIAIRRALERPDIGRFEGATLYVTLEPCAQCAGAILLARVPRVVFGAWDPRAGMAGSIHDLLRDARLNHRVEVVPGVLESECAGRLQGFFRDRRAGGLSRVDPG